MLNDTSSALSLLETRRSGRPRDMTGPGPSDEQLQRMLAVAARVPDHGGLVPFRFIVIAADQRDALAALYEKALRKAEPDAPQVKIDKAVANAHAAPVLVVLVSAPIRDHKIPLFEQELSCGAAGMNLLHAATAMGFVGGWITGWPAYDPLVAASFCQESERVAGLIYIGQPGYPLEERARPSLDRIASRWSGEI